MKEKWMTPKEAVQCVKSGHRVLVSSCCAEPQTLLEALVENKENLERVEILCMVPMGNGPYLQAGMERHFRLLTFVGGKKVGNAYKRGQVEYIPCHLREGAKLIAEGKLSIDVAFLHLSPPDENGFLSFGISVDYVKEASEKAKIKVAEVNHHMPHIPGDSLIHISELDILVETSRPLLTLDTQPLQEEDLKIGQYIAELISDGATLQIGIGTIPDAILYSLKDKKDLGIHSGLIGDGVMELMKEGVITNERKVIDRGKVVTSGIMGSEKLYRFTHKNPSFHMRPISYVADIKNIALFCDFISINSAIEVDLTGQVNAEMVDGVLVGGIGGQVDFIRGATFSPGGKSIIALRATAKGESKIVSVLGKGIPITTARSDVHYAVTEYGVADLRGKTLRQRKEALIAIAHPKFREGLHRF